MEGSLLSQLKIIIFLVRYDVILFIMLMLKLDFGFLVFYHLFVLYMYYLQVESVRLPRNVADKRCFCGTALVEFLSEDDAKNILKQKLVFAGVELELEPK